MEKRWILVLSVCLGLSLLTIAFLAGRLTAPAKQLPAASPAAFNGATLKEPAPSLLTSPSLVGQLATPKVESEPAKESAMTAPLPQHAIIPTAVISEPQRGGGDAAAIAAYFAQIDAIHAMGSGDPNAFAQEILSGAEGGDLSGFDNLLSSAQLALRQTEALQPPAECAGFHRQLTEALSESANLMEKVRNAMKTGDIENLAAITPQIDAIRQKTAELETLRKQLTGQ